MSALNARLVERQYYFLNNLANININYIVDPLPGIRKSAKEKAAGKLLRQAKKMNNVLAHPDVIAFIGEWEIVWGPFLSFSKEEAYFHKKGRAWAADNTMYMARLKKRPASDVKKELPDYYIGVAGTNPASPFGWFTEDFRVDEVVNWPPTFLDLPNTGQMGAKVSKGTALGVCRLWHMGNNETSPCVADQGLEVTYAGDDTQSLWGYIQAEIKGDVTIRVGGHSLGGALSPTFATSLADKIAASSNSTLKSVKIAAFPTAGPTPGNEAFADHMADVLSDYLAVYNEIDLVPQAWELDALKKVPTFYATCGFTNDNKNKKRNTFHLKANNLLVQRFIEWAMAQPAMTFKREPSTSRPNFTVKTWNNGCIKVKEETNKKGTKTLYQILPGTLKTVSKIIERLYLKDISAIAGRSLDLKNAEDSLLVEEFIGFLAYAGLQHTAAYVSTKESGLQLPDAAVKVYKDQLAKTSDKVATLNDGKNSLGYLFGMVAKHFTDRNVA